MPSGKPTREGIWALGVIAKIKHVACELLRLLEKKKYIVLLF